MVFIITDSFINDSMKVFLKHLASVLFPRGKNDLFGTLRQWSGNTVKICLLHKNIYL